MLFKDTLTSAVYAKVKRDDELSEPVRGESADSPASAPALGVLPASLLWTVRLNVRAAMRWRPMTRRSFVGMCYLLACAYFNSVLQVYADRRGPKGSVLPDIGFELLPHIDWPGLCDGWLTFMIVTTAFRFMFVPVKGGIVFRKVCAVQGTMLFLRGISVWVTSLPTPLPQCVSSATRSPWIEGPFIMFGARYTCNDVLFSGHTVTFTIMALVWSRYSHGKFHEFYWPFKVGVTANPKTAAPEISVTPCSPLSNCATRRVATVIDSPEHDREGAASSSTSSKSSCSPKLPPVQLTLPPLASWAQPASPSPSSSPCLSPTVNSQLHSFVLHSKPQSGLPMDPHSDTAGCLGEEREWTLPSLCAWAVAVGGYFVLVMTHFHYTVDVFIGAALCACVFQLYQHCVRICACSCAAAVVSPVTGKLFHAPKRHFWQQVLIWYEDIQYSSIPLEYPLSPFSDDNVQCVDTLKCPSGSHAHQHGHSPKEADP